MLSAILFVPVTGFPGGQLLTQLEQGIKSCALHHCSQLAYV